MVAIVVIGLVPVVLSVIYMFKPVHPVSTLMLGRWLTLQPVDRKSVV